MYRVTVSRELPMGVPWSRETLSSRSRRRASDSVPRNVSVMRNPPPLAVEVVGDCDPPRIVPALCNAHDLLRLLLPRLRLLTLLLCVWHGLTQYPADDLRHGLSFAAGLPSQVRSDPVWHPG